MIIFVLTLCIRTYFSQSIKRCVSSFGRRPNEKKKSAVLISSANNSLNMNGNFYLHTLEKKLINFCIFAISSFSTRHVNTFLIKAGDLIFNLFYFPPLLKAQHWIRKKNRIWKFWKNAFRKQFNPPKCLPSKINHKN